MPLPSVGIALAVRGWHRHRQYTPRGFLRRSRQAGRKEEVRALWFCGRDQRLLLASTSTRGRHYNLEDEVRHRSHLPSGSRSYLLG
jgi:hypothetical protein